MRESIYKLWTGQYIDLNHILMISDAYFIDRMGNGGWFRGFSIQFMFMDKPRDFVFDVDREKYVRFKDEHQLLIKGEWIGARNLHLYDANQSDAVKDLQVKVDEVIRVWKEFKDGKP